MMNGVTSSRAFAVLLTLLCLATAIAYVVGTGGPNPGGTPVQLHAQDAPAATIAFKVLLLTSTACAAGWFVHAFTGDPEPRRQEQVKFAYFFVIGSFAVLMIPPFVKNQAIGSELIGIYSGCVTDADAAAQVRCDPDQRPPQRTGEQVEGKAADAANPAPATATVPKPAHNQWLVNLGGAVRSQPGEKCTPSGSTACAPGHPGDRVNITGGAVVPLPVVIIALFGGAISLSRRVPEIQKRSELGYEGTVTEPKIDAREAREELVFQMMQFVSAPLIAIIAHQMLAPSTQASAVALAFLAGFGSETLLLMIRGVAEGLQPRSVSQRATPAAAGVTGDGEPRVTDGAAGSALAAGRAPLMLGKEPQSASATAPAPGPAPVHIRLCVEDDGLEAGSLALRVDGTLAVVPSDGCVELELAPGQPHRVEARGRRAGQDVHGELAVMAHADDEGRPFQLALA